MIALEFTLGTVIRLLREQKGLSQLQLGVNKTTISQLELGNREPKRETLKRIAEHLGVTVADIENTIDILNGKINLASLQLTAYSCQNPAHAALHIQLDEILNSDREDLIAIINASLETLSASAAGESPGSVIRRPATMKELQESTSLPNSAEFIYDRGPKRKSGGRR